jgi:predicted Zn-dependent peptidase
MKDTGLLVIYTGVSPSKAPSVIKLISKEIKKIRKDGVTVDELDKVKEHLKGNVVLAMENTYNRMSQLANRALPGQALHQRRGVGPDQPGE